MTEITDEHRRLAREWRLTVEWPEREDCYAAGLAAGEARCEQAEARAAHWKRLAVRALHDAPGWATHIQEDIDAERDTEGGSDD